MRTVDGTLPAAVIRKEIEAEADLSGAKTNSLRRGLRALCAPVCRVIHLLI